MTGQTNLQREIIFIWKHRILFYNLSLISRNVSCSNGSGWFSTFIFHGFIQRISNQLVQTVCFLNSRNDYSPSGKRYNDLWPSSLKQNETSFLFANILSVFFHFDSVCFCSDLNSYIQTCFRHKHLWRLFTCFLSLNLWYNLKLSLHVPFLFQFLRDCNILEKQNCQKKSWIDSSLVKIKLVSRFSN